MTPRPRTVPVHFALLGTETDSEDIATRVYFALLRHPRPTRELLIEQGFPAEALDRALSVLAATGLIDTLDPDRIVIAEPDVALPTYAASLERQARTTRASAAALTRIYRKARDEAQSSSDRPVNLRMLEGWDALRSGYAEILSMARHELLWIVSRGPVPEQILLDADRRTEMLTQIHPDTTVRVVLDRDYLELPGGTEAIGDLIDAGIDLRGGRQVIPSIVVADDRAALLDVSAVEPTGSGSALIRQPTHVKLIATWMDGVVAAAPAITQARRSPELPSIDERDRQILSLLAAGSGDATIARLLHVSRRTVERRVSAIIAALGAATRFQAGVEASRRGLI